MSIDKHVWSDGLVDSVDSCTDEIDINFKYFSDWGGDIVTQTFICINKQDAIAIAKHFGLIDSREENKLEEMPIFKGTRDALNNLTIKGVSGEQLSAKVG